ncbi:MAG: purine-nucleoside phosphorylase [Dehalococcoidia bacterium]|nr:purine-nucleoside phosphorylase [Dehalococcoidia bacterium]
MKRTDRLDPLQAREAAQQIALSTSLRPTIGLVLGSGWASVSQSLAEAVTIDYQDIPHFHKPQVEGHPGCMAVGGLSGRTVAVLSGRSHVYEGYTAAEVAFPVLALKELGVTDLILTNAAGGLNSSFRPGDLMVVVDHLNLPGLAGVNPLTGVEGAFVDLRDAYDRGLIDLARAASSYLGMTLHEGVYAMVGGPNYETRAEVNLLRSLGADAVGMSTVHEVLAARWAGLKVLAISLITNVALRQGTGLTHQEVLRTAEAESQRMRAFTERLVASWPC